MSQLPGKIRTAIEAPTFDPCLRGRIAEWAESPAFCAYLSVHDAKIAKKLRGATEIEGQRDLGYELYVAFIFCVSGCTVVCEPLGQQCRGPDLKVSVGDGSFYCEVRRIRESESESSWSDLARRLEGDLADLAFRYNSLGLIIDEPYDSFRYPQSPLELIEEHYHELLDYLRERAAMRFEDCELIPVASLPEGLAVLQAQAPPEGGVPCWGGIVRTVPITGKEYKKFGSILCEKLRQTVPDSVNVFHINAMGFEYWADDFTRATKNLLRLREICPEKFLNTSGFESIERFNEAWTILTACVVRTSSSSAPMVWENPNAAEPLSSALKAKLHEGIRTPFRGTGELRT